MIDKAHRLPITKQVRLLGLSRSSVYYEPVAVSDELHTELPFDGTRMIRGELLARGFAVGRGHIATLMRRMGISAIAPKRRTTNPAPGHRIYPYLLRGRDIEAHHNFPRKYATEFARRRIDCNNPKHGSWWERGPHRRSSAEINTRWGKWLTDHPRSGKWRTLRYGRKLAKEYGLKTHF